MSDRDPASFLLEAVLAFYGGADNDRFGEMLDAVRAELARAERFDPSPAPRVIGASALLAPALRAMTDVQLAAAIDSAAPSFRWRQNPNYSVETMGTEFMAGYGYVEFAGPTDALFRAPGIRVGLLLLGPSLHYPLHAHPAEEIYHPLTEGGLWRRGQDGWRAVAPGTAIHHAPMVPHETKATDRTILALYCWRGDTTTEARLTR